MIRPITPSDMPKLKDIIRSNGLFPPELLDDMVANFFAHQSAEEFWLTVEEPEPIAVAYYRAEPMTQGTWNVLLIAVHADFQGKGHGARLMDHIERHLRDRGERVLLVETSGLPGFELTRAFYDKLDYSREGLIREFYAAGEDKIIFRKSLG